MEGLDSKDIKESYSGANSAIQELKDSHEILTVHNSECNSEVLFYNDQTLKTPLDFEFTRLWREIRVPDEINLDRELRRGKLHTKAVLFSDIMTYQPLASLTSWIKGTRCNLSRCC
jgi:hypothetical protein